MTDSAEAARIFLVTPPDAHRADFPALLEAALGAADVAAVLIDGPVSGKWDDVAARLITIIQRYGAAALVAEDTRVAGRLKADGVHVGSGMGDLRAAIDTFRPRSIVGAGNLHSRHTAMEAAEAGADYVFFGRPQGDTHDEPHPKALDLAEWWSDLMAVPAVMMGGRSLDSVPAVAATGTAFVALRQAIWTFPGGPAQAVRLAAAALHEGGRRAA